MTTNFEQTYEKLKKIRVRNDLKLRKLKHLKDTYTDFGGVERPLKLRYYQIQGMLHLVMMRRFMLGDDTGLGKTVETIAALCYAWEQEPNRKAVVFTTKSASKQWAEEFAKFTQGIRVILCRGTPAIRTAARKRWEDATGPTVIIMGYGAARRDFAKIQDWEDYSLVCDEATVFKNPKTQIHQIVKYLSDQAYRAWGLTATLIKNNLMEGYGIYRVLVPGLFDMTERQFMYYYALVRMQTVAKGRQVPVIEGYLPLKIQEFKRNIDPYYIGRPKHEVADDLPALLPPVLLEVDMDPDQDDKYAEALEGFLEVGKVGEEETKELTQLTAITYCQQIANALELMGGEGSSPKIRLLVELLSEGDLEMANVIVFSRFRKMIDLAMVALKKAKINAVRITGTENEDKRERAKKAFQDPREKARVACITTAGSDAINLQAAEAIICLDTPWSAGDFLQLLGRMIRIGSVHERVQVMHLLARSQRFPQTVDHRVMGVLNGKMDLLEAVLGKRLKGDRTQKTIKVGSDMADLFQALRMDARQGK